MPAVCGEWADSGACVGLSDLFFRYRATGEDVATAKAICAKCPVKTQCLEHALVNFEQYGVWGGLSSRQLANERKRRGIQWKQMKETA